MIQRKQNNENKSETNNLTGKKLIGYRGSWYDVTNFVSRHPGGDVIERFLGQDATSVIETFHNRDVLKFWKPVKKFEKVSEADMFEKEMQELEQYLKTNHYYDSSGPWYVGKCFILLVIFVLNLLASVHGLTTTNSFTVLASGFFLAVLWQQSGFMMHDAMHTMITRRIAYDEHIGLIFGTFVFGMSARWWKDEHIVHHALTNTVDDHDVIDKQADEMCWAQNQMLFPMRMSSELSRMLTKIQTWIFFPFCVALGRVGIVVDSLREEKRPDVWIAWLLHNCWVALYLYHFDSWRQRAVVYFIGALGEGVLHVQLLVNHYTKSFYEYKERNANKNFRMMIECNMNVSCPAWMDWFHGGLNWHHEHHCFPRLPRNRLRQVSPMIKRVCAKHGVRYESMRFLPAVKNLIRHIHEMQIQFNKLDIRN